MLLFYVARLSYEWNKKNYSRTEARFLLDFLLVLFVTAAEMAAADLATKDWLFHTSASGTQLGMQLIILYRHFFSDLALLIFMF